MLRAAIGLLLAPVLAFAADLTKLEALPLADRQTRAHQEELAAAYQAADKPQPASDAVRMAEMLPGAPGDVSDVQKWLSKKALEEYKAGVAALEKNDRANAVKSYLRALMLDSVIQAKDDKGLRDLGLRTLDNAVKKKEDPQLRWKHAVISYLCGRLVEADASFAEYLKIEKNPYYVWRGQKWQEKLAAERAAMKSQDEKDAQASAARKAQLAAEDLKAQKEAAAAAAAPKPVASAKASESPETAEKRKQIQAEIDKIDTMITATQNLDAVKAAVPDKYGKLVDRYADSAIAKKKIADLNTQKAALTKQLEELQ